MWEYTLVIKDLQILTISKFSTKYINHFNIVIYAKSRVYLPIKGYRWRNVTGKSKDTLQCSKTYNNIIVTAIWTSDRISTSWPNKDNIRSYGMVQVFSRSSTIPGLQKTQSFVICSEKK